MYRNVLLVFLLSLNVFTPNLVRSQTNSPTEKKAEEMDSKNATKDIQPPLKESKIKYVPPKANPIQPQKIIQMEAYRSQFESTYKTATHHSNRRTPLISEQEQLTDLAQLFRTKEPTSFESFYFTYLAGNYSMRYLPLLQEAHQLQPSNLQVMKQLLMCYDALNKKDSSTAISKRMSRLNFPSKGQLLYGKDVLMSIETGEMLIAHAIDDYCVFRSVQLNNKEFTQVEVISFELMQSDVYQDNLKKEGFELPLLDVVDTEYLKQFCALNSQKKVIQISLTFPKDYLEPLSNRLYIRGLTGYYSTMPIDFGAVNTELWNKKMNREIVETSVDVLSDPLGMNYLPMTVGLYHQYRNQGKTKEMEAIQVILERYLKRTRSKLTFAELVE